MKSSTIVSLSLPFLILFTLLSTFTPTLCNLNSEKQALLQFSASIFHSKRLNWNISTQVCSSWIGIACDSNKTRVVSIRLPAIGLAGKIPPNTVSKLNSLRILSLRSNLLSGNIPSDITSIPSLELLYLQDNNFSGEIPSSLSPQLAVLDLSFNSISGEIPAKIQNLTRLAKLNLQGNRISGTIPPYLDLPRLKLLNLSHNQLNGSIPNSLQKHPLSSFTNNLLCGMPLENPCPMKTPTISTIHSKKPEKKTQLGTDSIIAIAIGCAAAIFIFFLALFLCRLKKRRQISNSKAREKTFAMGKEERPSNSLSFGSGVHNAEKNKLFFFPGCPESFDLEDLLRASAEILGKGNNGTTYKAVLDEGSTTVVVKRLREVSVGKREFEQQMEAVAAVGDHPNVVPLRAYYYSKDEKLLVYSYIPSGSLFSHLHGFRGAERIPLDWETRIKISLDAARGISHIHSISPSSVHGNIKSQNILLGPNLEAQVSDHGLTPITTTTTNPPIPSRHGLHGYRAPEAAAEPLRLSQSSDVYSFGVLILEILTGKSPGGHEGAVDLPRWVRSVVREEWTSEVFDVEILRHQHAEEEMVQMLQIGLACSARLPESRPSMVEVVGMIQEIRGLNDNNGKASATPSTEYSEEHSNIAPTP